MTYDPTTDEGKVRLLISDTDEAAEIFTDEEIEVFLDLEGSVHRAAAQALDTIADNDLQVLKVIETMDLKVDGAKYADSLRKRAAALRTQADDLDAVAGDEFAVAEFADPVFGERSSRRRHAIRGL